MKKLLSLIAAIFMVATTFAQDEVTLTVIGTGENEEIATQNALRNALEEAYGAFLVSRTSIIMDELASDEIVVNTNGQIKEFKHNAISTLPNGHISVSLTATVSMQKIISYAQGKGCEVAFMGEAFDANLKMMQLKVDNATKTLRIVTKQIEDLSKNLFNFELSMGHSPALIKIEDKQYYVFKGQLEVYSNDASHHIYNLLHSTLLALRLSYSDVKFFKRYQLPISKYTIDEYEYGDRYDFIPMHKDTLYKYIGRICKSTRVALTRVEIQEIGKGNTHDYIWNSINEFSFCPESSFKIHEFHFPIRKSLTEKEIKLVKKYKYEGPLCTDSVVYVAGLIANIVFPLYIPKDSMATFQGFKLNGKQVFAPSCSLMPDNPLLLKILQGYYNNKHYISDISDEKLKYHFIGDERDVYSRMPFELVNRFDERLSKKDDRQGIPIRPLPDGSYYYVFDEKSSKKDDRLLFDESALLNEGSVDIKAFCAAYYARQRIEIRNIGSTIHIDGHRVSFIGGAGEYDFLRRDGGIKYRLSIDSYRDNNGKYWGGRYIELNW